MQVKSDKCLKIKQTLSVHLYSRPTSMREGNALTNSFQAVR